MIPFPKTFAAHAGLSSLCTVFRTRLTPCWEEGIARHFVHRPCQQVVVDEQGRLAPDVDIHLAVVFGLERLSPLREDMEEELRTLKPPPFESIYLTVPIESLRDPVRPQFMVESSDRLLSLSETGAPVILAAISHRRRIGTSLVLRHYPVAIFDAEGALDWVHPAGHSYGLIRSEFPPHQRVRRLGRRLRRNLDPYGLRGLDEETGLPRWYRSARDQLIEKDGVENPSLDEVISFDAAWRLHHALASDAEQAMREATLSYLHGFESFFGCGGLHPTPGVLEFP